jgi:hypothetical protein
MRDGLDEFMDRLRLPETLRAGFRRLNDALARQAAGARHAPTPACRFLGADTGRLEDCPSCCGRVRLKLLACAHPEAGPETTLRRCQGCAYFEAQG